MELKTARETASVLGITEQTVSRLAREDRLPQVKVGQRRLFEQDAIDRYLEDNNLSPAPADHPRLTEDVPEIVAASFFSGALGLDLGIEEAGITPLLLCENDTKCRMTIASNRPAAGLLGDITKVTAYDVYAYARVSPKRGIDVMFGGPPCQAFSTAGARRAFDDARGNVFLSFLDLAADIRPRVLAIENVRGLLSTAFPLERNGEPVRGGALRTVLSRLDAMGYTYSFNLYNAANFGAPQIRERVVIIATREGGPAPWLTPTHSNDPSWGLPAWRTLRDAIEGISGEQHFVSFPEKRLRYFKMLHEGQCWRDLPLNLQEEAMGKAYRLSGGKTGFYRRLRMDRPCPTLVTSPTMPATDLCHPTEDRPLSVEEYKAIQGFPDDWVIRGSIQDVYRQIGNTVPVALGRAVGRTIASVLSGKWNPEDDERFLAFPYSRYRCTSEKSWHLC